MTESFYVTINLKVRRSWNDHNYSTEPHDLGLSALRTHTFDIQTEWNMNLAAQEATDHKHITITIDFEIQKYCYVARCRHKSMHITYTRQESATIYNDIGLQTLRPA